MNICKCKVTAKWFGPSEVEEAIELIDGVLEACVWVMIICFCYTNTLIPFLFRAHLIRT